MAEYIEREAVSQVLQGIANGLLVGETEALKVKDMKSLLKIKAAKEILKTVDNDLCFIPTADVQPIRRGRWIAENQDNRRYADCYTCSNCQNYTYTYTLMRDCEYDYCPNCGADMRGDENG